MNRFLPIVIGIAILVVVVIATGMTGVLMPGKWGKPALAAAYNGLVPAEKLLRVPVTGIYPDGNPAGLEVNMQNPLKDDPDAVAARIVEAIGGRRPEVYLGFPEALFVRLNAILPGLVDRALASADRRVAGLFPTTEAH